MSDLATINPSSRVSMRRAAQLLTLGLAIRFMVQVGDRITVTRITTDPASESASAGSTEATITAAADVTAANAFSRDRHIRVTVPVSQPTSAML